MEITPKLAPENLNRLADRGHLDALLYLGRIYAIGKGGEENPAPLTTGGRVFGCGGIYPSIVSSGSSASVSRFDLAAPVGISK